MSDNIFVTTYGDQVKLEFKEISDTDKIHVTEILNNIKNRELTDPFLNWALRDTAFKYQGIRDFLYVYEDERDAHRKTLIFTDLVVLIDEAFPHYFAKE